MITIIFIIIVIIAIFGGLYHYNHAQLKHLSAIAPKDLVQYKGINLTDPTHNQKIGADPKHPVRYLGLDNQQRVLFPESAYGNQYRYYLAAVSFKPNLANQPSKNVKAAVKENQQPNKSSDQHTIVYLTLIKADFSDAFKIAVKAQNQDIHELNRTYVINPKALTKAARSIQN